MASSAVCKRREELLVKLGNEVTSTHLQNALPALEDRAKPPQDPSLLHTVRQVARAAYGSATATDWTPVTYPHHFLAEDNSHQQCENGDF